FLAQVRLHLLEERDVAGLDGLGVVDDEAADGLLIGRGGDAARGLELGGWGSDSQRRAADEARQGKPRQHLGPSLRARTSRDHPQEYKAIRLPASVLLEPVS